MDNSTGSKDDAWKIFNKDTEAGRILSRLYGIAPTKRVSYPKPQRRRATTDGSVTVDNRIRKGSWKTTYTVHGRDKAAEEEKERERKENTAKALGLAIPKVGRGSIRSNSKQTIEVIPRRKTEMGCKTAIEETLLKKRLYRPPHTRSISSDEEKNRLQQLMMDGKGQQGGSSTTTSQTTSDCGKSNEMRPAAATTLVDQLVCEIIERRRHQIAMEEVGAGESTREATAIEIKKRIEHLKRLDPHLASAVAQKLTS